MNSTDLRKFEEEVRDSLDVDDVKVLSDRVASHENYMALFGNRSRINHSHSRTQWTRIYDGVQEHFSSHVLINGTSHRLPSNIYALKQIAKQSWMLYKKRECERRKRLRIKLEKEREIERRGGPANILLSMVDACEVCRKLYVTVNLFWGVTICDSCYFNKDVIEDIMKKKNDLVEDDGFNNMDPTSNSLFQVASHRLAKTDKKKNDQFFTLPEEKKKTKSKTMKKVMENYDSPEVIEDDEREIFIEDIDLDEIECRHGEKNDFRSVSTYVSPPNLSVIEEEDEFIHEELSDGEWVEERNRRSFDETFHFEGSLFGGEETD